MSLTFITGNADKFKEASSIIPHLEQVDLDLPEIQEMNPEVIIKAKLQEALKHYPQDVIVEDTSLYLDAFNGFPGPLMKWMMRAIGVQGIYDAVAATGKFGATAKTVIGYARTADDIQYFEGIIKGTIVAPRGDKGFGWDPIFLPENQTLTFAEMPQELKDTFSMRRLAFNALEAALTNE